MPLPTTAPIGAAVGIFNNDLVSNEGSNMKGFKKSSADLLALVICICCVIPASAADYSNEQNLPTPDHFVGTPSWPLQEDFY